MGDHTLAVQVPSDDGSIQRAFTELDARLKAWLTAMSEAQHALCDRMRKPAPSEQVPAGPSATCTSTAMPSTPPATTVVRPPVKPVTEKIEPPIDGEIGAPPPGPPVAESEVAATVVVEPEPEPAPKRKPSQPKGIVGLVPSTAEAATTRERQQVEAAASLKQNVNEDEQALLASLDEETLKAIKVMRRLNPSQKTLRQLLAEYEATTSTRSTDSSLKKTWWKRGK